MVRVFLAVFAFINSTPSFSVNWQEGRRSENIEDRRFGAHENESIGWLENYRNTRLTKDFVRDINALRKSAEKLDPEFSPLTESWYQEFEQAHRKFLELERRFLNSRQYQDVRMLQGIWTKTVIELKGETESEWLKQRLNTHIPMTGVSYRLEFAHQELKKLLPSSPPCE